MSYSKKDEDGEPAIVKVDRTSVFQEGILAHLLPSRLTQAYLKNSSSLQYIPCVTTKMSDPSYKDRPTPIDGREVPKERSYRPVLRHLEALPEQRCQSTADGLSRPQRAGGLRGRYYHGHQQYYEGYVGRERCSLPRKCDSGSMSHNRCMLLNP